MRAKDAVMVHIIFCIYESHILIYPFFANRIFREIGLNWIRNRSKIISLIFFS